MLSNEIKEQIDSGFQILGTAPEREVLYDLAEKLLTSETGQRLYDLLGTKKKILLGFYHKERKGENIPYDGVAFILILFLIKFSSIWKSAVLKPIESAL